MQYPDAAMITDFLQWFQADEHSKYEDYYSDTITKNNLSSLSKQDLIDFFYEFKRTGGQIQSLG
ncbi:MAG: hypothetical protein AB7E47_07675 [Desulfovibrionaceae bacterium]